MCMIHNVLPRFNRDESAVYADSAYKSQAHDDYLAKHEPPINNHIHDRAWRNTP